MTKFEPSCTACGSGESARNFYAWIEAIVSKEIEKFVDNLTRDQLLDLRIATLRTLDATIAAKLGESANVPLSPEHPKLEQSNQLIFAQAPLALAIPKYLAICREPQTAKQITTALLEAGREFETKRPVHAVRTALARLVGANEDVFHVSWCKWWLKSKCTKTQLEKYLAKKTGFGTGGRSKKEHSKRTSVGIRKFRADGRKWGREPKATPELLERVRQMLRDGVSLTETCRTLNISTPTLYEHGISQRALKKEGELLRQRQAQAEKTANEPPSDSTADVIPLHGRAG